MEHYYVFYIDKNGNYFYERTCGTLESAEERVKILKTFYPDAKYFLNSSPSKYFY